MKNRRLFFVFGITAFVFLTFVSVQAKADVYMKQKTHTDPFKMMGQTQPAKDEIKIYWFGDGVARTDANRTSTLFFADRKALIWIDHHAKTYSELSMDFDKMFEEGTEGQTPEEKAEAKKMAEMMKGMTQAMMGSMSVKVTETNETKKIGDWNCRKYLIDTDMGMMNSKAVSWASQDLKVDFNAYFAMANAMMANMPGFDKIIQEMKKVKGVIVYQKSASKVMGQEMTSTTEILEYMEKSAPTGTYDIPAGYQKVKANR